MDTMHAFMLNMASQGCKKKVFDWDKAARIIREKKPKEAAAGLGGDWEWTGGTIYENGNPIMNDYTYLASTWAVPELEVDGETIECWVWENDTKWDADTKWPKSALEILKGEN